MENNKSVPSVSATKETCPTCGCSKNDRGWKDFNKHIRCDNDAFHEQLGTCDKRTSNHDGTVPHKKDAFVYDDCSCCRCINWKPSVPEAGREPQRIPDFDATARGIITRTLATPRLVQESLSEELAALYKVWTERAESSQPAGRLYDDLLLNLLAVIHRDGGHYTAQHGLEKSAADAEKKVVELLHSQPAGPTPHFPDCSISTPHECCVARMKRLEKGRGILWASGSGGTPPRDALIAYFLQRAAENRSRISDCTCHTEDEHGSVWHAAKADTYKRCADKVAGAALSEPPASTPPKEK